MEQEFRNLIADIEKLLDNGEYDKTKAKYLQMWDMIHSVELHEEMEEKARELSNTYILQWASRLSDNLLMNAVAVREKIQDIADHPDAFSEETIQALEDTGKVTRLVRFLREAAPMQVHINPVRSELNTIATEIQEITLDLLRAEFYASMRVFQKLRDLRAKGDFITRRYPGLAFEWSEWCQNPLQSYAF